MMLILILSTILVIPSSVYLENATVLVKNAELPINGAPAPSQPPQPEQPEAVLGSAAESKNSSLIIIKNVQTKTTNGADLTNQQLHEISQEKTSAQKNDGILENPTPSRKVTDTGFIKNHDTMQNNGTIANNSMPINKKAIVAEGIAIKLTSDHNETSKVDNQNATLQVEVKQVNQNKTESNHDSHEANDKVNLKEIKANKTEEQNQGKNETSSMKNAEIPGKPTLNVTLPIDSTSAKNSSKITTTSSPKIIQTNSTILPTSTNGTAAPSLPSSPKSSSSTSTTTTTKSTTTTTTTTPKPKKPLVAFSTEDHPELDIEVLKQKNSAANGQKDNSKLPIAEPPIVQPSQEMNSDFPYENGRDYIVPVITIIFCIPLAIGIVITAYRRFRDFWSTRHYRRMDFLVDGMYND